jgi:hypothetical protein
MRICCANECAGSTRRELAKSAGGRCSLRQHPQQPANEMSGVLGTPLVTYAKRSIGRSGRPIV